MPSRLVTTALKKGLIRLGAGNSPCRRVPDEQMSDDDPGHTSGWQHGNVRVIIEGYDLPGRTFCDSTGAPYTDVHVGVQIRKDPEQLVAADADAARWELDVDVVTRPDGSTDFSGPAVHGRRGDRFLYLTWGNVGADGRFDMFRRAKLMLDRIDPPLVQVADQDGRHLIARVRLSDDDGTPRCARVDPPDLEWASG